MSRQLALPFAHLPRFGGADFLQSPSNAEALAWLAHAAEWPQRRLALWGEAGRGKTHLAQIWAARIGACVIDGADVRLAPPDGPLAIDNAETTPERPLLHLLNAAAEAGFPVLLASRAPPGRWPVALPDLASRLRAMLAVEVGPPDDALLRALFARLLAERQIAVSETVQDWLLLRLPRTAAAVRDAAGRLDAAALAAGGAVTRSLAAAVLASCVRASSVGASGVVASGVPGLVGEVACEPGLPLD